MATLINGTETAATITSELQTIVTQHKEATGKQPCLAVILVGDRKDSATYVRNKKKACEKVGIISVGYDVPATITQQELLDLIQKLNQDDTVHGILVQLPLPAHIHEQTVIATIAPTKDVDGLHPYNAGLLAQLGPEKINLISCTPLGCMELLKRYHISIEGKHAVVLGRSNIVGKPVATLLLAHNATVTVCHSRTPNVADVIRTADIVIVAIGKAEYVQGDWIKPGAVVIDVGINAVDDATKATGYRLVGDVAFAQAKEVASAITPVPGGVGPMTIAMLMRNTVKAFEAQTGISKL